MSTRNAFVCSIQALLIFAVLVGTISAAHIVSNDVLRNLARSSLRQTVFTYHEIASIWSGRIEPPSSVSLGDDPQALMHEEVIREKFVRRILDSNFSLVGVETEFTPGGHLTQIEPLFAPQPRSSLRKEYFLVFLPG